MQVHIRGGIGTQILSFLIELALHGDSIERVIHEFGGYHFSPERRLKESSVGVSHIENVIDLSFDIVFEESTGRSSTPINKQTIKKLSEKIEDVRKLARQKIVNNFDNVFHVRMYDSQLLSLENYKKMCSNLDDSGIVISDDYDTIKTEIASDKIPNIDNTNNDWLIAANSKNLYGPFSTFTLSAAIINPNINMNLVHHDYYTSDIHGSTSRLNQVAHLNDVFVNSFENINYVYL